MAIKVRATMHNGRTRASGEAYCVKHNDRDFNIAHAEHINPTPERKNRYFIVAADGTVDNNPKITFEQHEKQVYAALFSEALSRQAERYVKDGHAERIRSTEDYRTAPRTCPEETILQLGTREEHADPQAFIKAVNRWCQQMQAAYGTHWRLLDGCLHFDESTIHCHIRQIYIVTGKDGLQISQSKALKELGIQRPNPEKPESKHNNAKMTFTQQARQIWIAAAREYGIEIEEIPETPGRATRTKEEYIAQKVRTEIVELSEQRDQIRAEATQANSERAVIQDEITALKKTKRRLEAAIERIRQVLLPVQRLIEKLATYHITPDRTVLDDIIADAHAVPALDTIQSL